MGERKMSMGCRRSGVTRVLDLVGVGEGGRNTSMGCGRRGRGA